MAIIFEYLYRDGGNLKNWGEACFKNEQGLSLEEIDARIRECLIDEMYFTAEKVGLPTLYFDEHNEQLDHEWHEYDRVREDTENTASSSSIELLEFLHKFK